MSNAAKDWQYDKNYDDNELFRNIIKFMHEELDGEQSTYDKVYIRYLLMEIQRIGSCDYSPSA